MLWLRSLLSINNVMFLLGSVIIMILVSLHFRVLVNLWILGGINCLFNFIGFMSFLNLLSFNTCCHLWDIGLLGHLSTSFFSFLSLFFCLCFKHQLTVRLLSSLDLFGLLMFRSILSVLLIFNSSLIIAFLHLFRLLNIHGWAIISLFICLGVLFLIFLCRHSCRLEI